MVKLVQGDHLRGGLARIVENAAAGVLSDSARVLDLEIFLREGKPGDYVVANRPLKNWEILEISRRGGMSLEISTTFTEPMEQEMAIRTRMKLEQASKKKS